MRKWPKAESLLYYSLVVLLVGISFLLVKKHDKYASVLSALGQTTNDLVSCKNENESLVNVMHNIMRLQWKIEGKRIKKNLVLRNIDNHRISFDSLINSKDGKVIILRFSWNNCEDCQLQEMKFLEEIKEYDNTLVIVSYKSYKDFVLYMKALDVKLRAYFLEDTQTMIDGNHNGVEHVFSFITDKSYQISNVHIGNASFDFLSKSYYTIIAAKIAEHEIIPYN